MILGQLLSIAQVRCCGPIHPGLKRIDTRLNAKHLIKSLVHRGKLIAKAGFALL